MKTSRTLMLTAVILCTLQARTALAADVEVTVSEIREVGGVRYSYRIDNHSARSVVALRIGFDYLHGVPELEQQPLGWNVIDGLPANSATSPTGWTVAVVSMEENPFIDIQWEASGGSQFDVRAGTNVGGFTVRVDRETAEYTTAHFDVILADSTHAYGTVQPERITRRRAVRTSALTSPRSAPSPGARSHPSP